MNISDYLRTALLNHALGVASYTPPSSVWAGLFQVSPTSAGGGTEVVASDYVRIKTTWSVGALGVIQNSLPLRFPTSGVTLSSWGTVRTLALFDNASTGNLLFFGDLSAPVLLAMNTDFAIATGYLTITLV